MNAETGSGTEVDHDILNARKTAVINIMKVESVNTAKPVAGAKYALYAGSGIINHAGETVLSKDSLVAYAVTDALGQAVFSSEDGTPVDLPIGYTWYVRELYVPAGYSLDETEYQLSFTETDSDSVHIELYVNGDTVTNDQLPGSVTIAKKDVSGRALAGATYLLEYAAADSGPWAPVFANDGTVGEGYVAGGCDAAGLSNGTLTTGADGIVSFTGLLADGSVYYRITEVHAPDGYQLLAESIFVGALPMEAENQPMNRLYDLRYSITDSAVLELPMTGSSGFRWLPVSVFGLLAGYMIISLAAKKRRSYSAE